MLIFRRRPNVPCSVLLLAVLSMSIALSDFPAVAQLVSSQPVNPVASRAEERALRVEWSKLFDNHSWAELDSVAERLRSGRLRFQGGAWQLHVLYCVLSSDCSRLTTDAAWRSRIADLQDWIRYEPSSPTPRIALADTYEDFAWKARGNGFADSVTQQDWKLFERRMEKAYETLDGSQGLGRNDPEWYNAMLSVAVDQGWNRTRTEAIADEALSRYPGYFYAIREAADYFLPKWYGAPGDTERYLTMVANRIGGEEGDATYFFVAEILLVHEYHCPDCSPPAMSWTRIRRGFAAIQHLYGTNNYELNALAFLALHAGDTQTAHDAFQQIGDRWDSDVWESKAQFDNGHILAHSRPVPTATSPYTVTTP